MHSSNILHLVTTLHPQSYHRKNTFVELVKTNPLMYNINHLGYKESPAICLKIVVQTDCIDSGMYSQRPFE